MAQYEFKTQILRLADGTQPVSATIRPVPTIFVPAETVLPFDPFDAPFRFGLVR
jgi:hypothetical protein